MITPLQIGDRLSGTQSYEIIGVIGHGGLSTVYRVRSPDGQHYAAKVPSDHRFPIDENAIARLHRELFLLREVRHRHLLQTVDVAEYDGLPVAITPLASGGDLHRRLIGKAPVTLATAFDWIIQMTSGLAALHEQGIVHRDLTPKNVFFIDDDRLVIGDLGIARHLDDETITELTDHIGSLIYISAQQRETPHDASLADDVFSLGQVAFFILTSILPHGGLIELATFRPDCPAPWISIIEGMRAHERSVRPRSAAEVLKSIFPLHPEPTSFLEQPDATTVRILGDAYRGGSISRALHLNGLNLVVDPAGWDCIFRELISLPDLRSLVIRNGAGTPAEQAGRYTGNWWDWYFRPFPTPLQTLTSVKGLESLEELDLACCGLTNWPHNIERLTRLKRLSVRGNYLTEWPAWLAQLTSLEELDISENEIYEFDLSPFVTMRRLTRLVLRPTNDDLRLSGFEEASDNVVNPLKGTPPFPEELRELRINLGKHEQRAESEVTQLVREAVSPKGRYHYWR